MLDGSARLEVIQTTQFKTTQLLSFDCFVCHDEFIRQKIQYKYHQVRKNIRQLENRLTDADDLVKLKNPSLQQTF
jgi:hypothetical protein